MSSKNIYPKSVVSLTQTQKNKLHPSCLFVYVRVCARVCMHVYVGGGEGVHVCANFLHQTVPSTAN